MTELTESAPTRSIVLRNSWAGSYSPCLPAVMLGALLAFVPDFLAILVFDRFVSPIVFAITVPAAAYLIRHPFAALRAVEVDLVDDVVTGMGFFPRRRRLARLDELASITVFHKRVWGDVVRVAFAETSFDLQLSPNALVAEWARLVSVATAARGIEVTVDDPVAFVWHRAERRFNSAGTSALSVSVDGVEVETPEEQIPPQRVLDERRPIPQPRESLVFANTKRGSFGLASLAALHSVMFVAFEALMWPVLGNGARLVISCAIAGFVLFVLPSPLRALRGLEIDLAEGRLIGLGILGPRVLGPIRTLRAIRPDHRRVLGAHIRVELESRSMSLLIVPGVLAADWAATVAGIGHELGQTIAVNDDAGFRLPSREWRKAIWSINDLEVSVDGTEVRRELDGTCTGLVFDDRADPTDPPRTITFATPWQNAYRLALVFTLICVTFAIAAAAVAIASTNALLALIEIYLFLLTAPCFALFTTARRVRVNCDTGTVTTSRILGTSTPGNASDISFIGLVKVRFLGQRPGLIINGVTVPLHATLTPTLATWAGMFATVARRYGADCEVDPAFLETVIPSYRSHPLAHDYHLTIS